MVTIRGVTVITETGRSESRIIGMIFKVNPTSKVCKREDEGGLRMGGLGKPGLTNTGGHQVVTAWFGSGDASTSNSV